MKNFLKSIYFSIRIYIKIFSLIKSRKIFFLKKIIYSSIFVNFNPVKSEEKKVLIINTVLNLTIGLTTILMCGKNFY